MSVCKSLAPARSGLGGLFGFGVVALIAFSGTPNQSFAGTGVTSGGNFAGANSHGSGFSGAGINAATHSRASKYGNYVSAETFSEGQAASVGLSKRGVRQVKVKTYALAAAEKYKKTLTALAAAGVVVAAEAADGSGQALVLSSSGSLAYAQSGKTLSAYAVSGTGAAALAETDGKKVHTTASIEGGTTATFRQGQSSYSIAYTDTGSFAMAMSDRKSVSAMTGTTTEAGAFTSGHLGALLKSSTFASAYADRTSASAYAESFGYGHAGGKSGSSSAFSHSWASASVTSGEHKKKLLTNSASKSCKSAQLLKKAKLTGHCNIEF